MFVHELMAYILAMTVGSTAVLPEYREEYTTVDTAYEAVYPYETAVWVTQTLAGTGSHGAADGSQAQFNLPASVFGTLDGALLIADTYNNLLRTVGDGGYTQRLAGNVLGLDVSGFPAGSHRDGAAADARLNRPADGAIDATGRIFIADSANHAIRVLTDGTVFTFAGGGAYGHVDGPVAAARFNRPMGLAIGPCGAIYVADTLNHVIRRICPAGQVSTVAGVPGVYGYADEDGTPLLNAPMGITVDPQGRLFVADTSNHVIRIIEDGNIRTLAGTVVFPSEIDWVDALDADFDEVPLGGFADGAYAMFNLPIGVALWDDILLVADSANHRIRGVRPDGDTFTLAGTGEPGHTDGYVPEAEFHFPRGVYVYGGRIYIADSGNNAVRVIIPVLDDVTAAAGGN